MNDASTPRQGLRERQRDTTRDLIVEGLIKVMADGAVTWSIPEVARAADVSVPTVYRYFGSKDGLVQGLGAYIGRKLGFIAGAPPRTPEELIVIVRQMFLGAEHLGDAMRMASVSELAQGFRREAMPMRLRLIEDALAPIRGQFTDEDWGRLVRVVVVLSSSAMIRTLADYLDLSGAPAADLVAWAISRLVASGSRQDAPDAT
jgi:AcrR family transcriptional regulator